MPAPRKVLAAGAVVWRPAGDDIELLVIHRPAHEDWTIPKGKVDPGERLPVTAVREVLEETSVPIRLGLPISTIEYEVVRPERILKRVSYWVGRPLGSGDINHSADHEVDEVRWVAAAKAPEVLTYDRDRELVAQLLRLRESSQHRTRPLIVLRHGHARARAKWKGADHLRPLSDKGSREAHQLVPLLAAYGISRVVTSPSTRCVQTVQPYLDHLDSEVMLDDGLSEERADAHTVAKGLRRLATEDRPTVLCTHRPVLPLVFTALGLSSHSLEPGGLLVAHRRGARVVGTETHLP
uniref:Hydrolase MutT1 n=1 Tax=uncultured Nocardioidaceae bacterium TaxID=253824 RepID=A0A6J4KM37_9ACTN|nr:MAG: Hydrolase MutT1 [uncultured Nocardioidaceae bacterium]